MSWSISDLKSSFLSEVGIMKVRLLVLNEKCWYKLLLRALSSDGIIFLLSIHERVAGENFI